MRNRHRLKVVVATQLVCVAAALALYLPFVLSDPDRPANRGVAAVLGLAFVPVLVWSDWQWRKYVRGLIHCPECAIPLEAVKHLETARQSLGRCTYCKRVYKYEKKV